MLSALTFVYPWLLFLLLSLPLLWWLLRLTPPSPRRISFPAIQFLFGLKPKEETPERTPWWLLLLRLILAGLIIISFAHPIFEEEQSFTRDGPVLLFVDNDWASTSQWESYRQWANQILNEAERSGKKAALVLTTEPPKKITFEEPRVIANLLADSNPKAWLPDRSQLVASLEAQNLPKDLNIFWLSDGLRLSSKDELLAAKLEEMGAIKIYRGDMGTLPRYFLPSDGNGRLSVSLARPAGGPSEQSSISAFDQQNYRLGTQKIRWAEGEIKKSVTLNWPLEFINRIKKLAIDGQLHAGAQYLLDGLEGAKPIGYIASDPENSRRALIGPLYYLERALGSDLIRAGALSQLLAQPFSMLILPDTTTLTQDERTRLRNWVEKGGMLIRFAGNNLAYNIAADDLVPVKLRSGIREFGGTLSWEQNFSMAPFPDHSPFAGLPLPRNLSFKAQILAEPNAELERKVWAKLSDGTPLVTGSSEGKGFLVLFHTSGNASWSDLVLSNTFVQMLGRLSDLSSGVALEEGKADSLLPPISLLDGSGQLTTPDITSSPLTVKEIAEGPAGPTRMPGIYGKNNRYNALNVTSGLKYIPVPLDLANIHSLANHDNLDLKPLLLLAVLLLLLIDLLLSLFLRGLLGRAARNATITAIFLFTLLFSLNVQAASDDEQIIKSVEVTRLAYVETGSTEVDRISRAGLNGLTGILLARTSADMGEPVAVNVETDDLSFYPILYWPISASQPPLTQNAAAKVNDYLARGGMIFFDTGDRPLDNLTQGAGGPGTERLQTITASLKIPPLIPIPANHVLGRSFYLLREYPGRWLGGELWVEQRGSRLNDGVTSIIIGSNDFAAAWAIDEYGRYLFPVTPGGERQREFAYRFGVNLVVYALTGNYKTDQVHIPAILQRLGQ